MKRPRIRIKRLILLLLTYAVGGAIINVAVAWGCVWGAHLAPNGQLVRLDDDNSSLWWIDHRFGCEGVRPYPKPLDKRIAFVPVYRGNAWWVDQPGFEADKWAVADGWPMLALRAWRQGDVWLGGWESSSKSTGPYSRIIPFTALWPGFAINTMFYAAILWLLVAAPGFVRRRIRVRRGQCPACAYPVGSSPVCTECGEPVKSRNIETQKAEMT